MGKYDVTKLNVAIDRLLAVTENPRHRFLLQAYSRHRYLEVAGRYEEIFAPEMMVSSPVYHLHVGGTPGDLRGQENVKNLYRIWAETNQSIFLPKTNRSPSRTTSLPPRSPFISKYGVKHLRSDERHLIC